jgi:hypothetical protein
MATPASSHNLQQDLEMRSWTPVQCSLAFLVNEYHFDISVHGAGPFGPPSGNPALVRIRRGLVCDLVNQLAARLAHTSTHKLTHVKDLDYLLGSYSGMSPADKEAANVIARCVYTLLIAVRPTIHFLT